MDNLPSRIFKPTILQPPCPRKKFYQGKEHDFPHPPKKSNHHSRRASFHIRKTIETSEHFHFQVHCGRFFSTVRQIFNELFFFSSVHHPSFGVRFDQTEERREKKGEKKIRTLLDAGQGPTFCTKGSESRGGK